MSYSTQGYYDKSIYGCCDYQQRLFTSTKPFEYQMYFGKEENCSKCIDNKPWYKFDGTIVDVESDLTNRTRPLSYCDAMKYSPNCKTSANCISTFSKSAPRIPSPSLCPIVYNNVPKPTTVGYNQVNMNICDTRYINGNNVQQNINMFLNNCSNTPIYQGGYETIKPHKLTGDNYYNYKNVMPSQPDNESYESF